MEVRFPSSALRAAAEAAAAAARPERVAPVSGVRPAEKVAPAPDPTALIRSLGDPPLRFHEADHYLAAVVERAAALAAALAASGGLLASPADPDD